MKKLIHTVRIIFTLLITFFCGNTLFSQQVKENNFNTNKINFYSIIQEKAYQSKITKEIYHLLFISPTSILPSDSLQAYQSDLPFLLYSGKKIRKIHLQKLDIFGPVIADTVQFFKSGITKFANRLSIKTRDYVIKQNLLFSPNDTINPLQIADNERILRSLPFIEDAKIYLQPSLADSNFVDVLIVTKDVWSWAFDAKFFGLNKNKFNVYDVNLLGYGHYIKHNFLYDSKKNQPLIYEEGLYKVENIAGSFFSSYLKYSKNSTKKSYEINILKELKTAATLYGGNINLSHNIDSVWHIKTTPNGFIRSLQPIIYDSLDIWAGRSLKIHSTVIFKNRPHIVISGRYILKSFISKPENPVLNQLKNETYLLGGIAFINQSYVTSNLIYNYGRTEDIPYGSLFALTVGKNLTPKYNRYYGAIKIAYASFHDIEGYYYFDVSTGGELKNEKYTNAIVKANYKYFTHLLIINDSKYKIRNFLTCNYTTALSDIDYQEMRFSDVSGIRGMKNQGIEGTQRFTLSLESVLFTPIEILDFRFAFFGFTDMGWIGSKDKLIFTQDFFSGIGLGAKIRNENLVFKTLQLRLCFYPDNPAHNNTTVFSLSSGEVFNIMGFNYNGPELVRFE
ncbi:MAG: hypothetical protein M0R21_04605 [Lentimicrobiaceae bacterium]|nr:hypothetical protein [Lentimicrobiaceae bacterium]